MLALKVRPAPALRRSDHLARTSGPALHEHRLLAPELEVDAEVLARVPLRHCVTALPAVARWADGTRLACRAGHQSRPWLADPSEELAEVVPVGDEVDGRPLDRVCVLARGAHGVDGAEERDEGGLGGHVERIFVEHPDPAVEVDLERQRAVEPLARRPFASISNDRRSRARAFSTHRER